MRSKWQFLQPRYLDYLILIPYRNIFTNLFDLSSLSFSALLILVVAV